MYKANKTTEKILDSIAEIYCKRNQAYDCPCQTLIDEFVKLEILGL